MKKTGVIGDIDSVLGFAAVGVNVFPVENIRSARERLSELAENDYGIIYVTEKYISEMSDISESYRKKQTPAIIAIPTAEGSPGAGGDILKKCIIRAVGANVV